MSRLFVRFHNVTFAYPSAAEPLFSSLSLHLPCGWSGVVGANGAGKTTLLKLATGQLTPDAGTVEAPRRAVYCPQRTDDAPGRLKELLDDRTKPAWSIREMLGVGMDWPDRWQTLSHGERKRAQIAVALWLKPDVLAVDEPTNHMDLPSIEALEAALADCPCALLLVSHDTRFLQKLTRTAWHIAPDTELGGSFILHIT